MKLLRRRREAVKEPYSLTHVRTLLEREGCPACHEVADHDPSYFFWFFNENYFESFTLDALTDSLGFCRNHAASLLATRGGAYPLAAVHQVLVRRVRRSLGGERDLRTRRGREEPALRVRAPCPACSSRREGAERGTYWTGRLLEDPSETERYGRPGLLCFPHLQTVVPRLSPSVLERLLAVHVDALLTAGKDLADERDHGSGGVPSGVLFARVALAVGHEQPTTYPGFAEPASRVDPVREFLEALEARRGCAVCREVGRAWIELGRWLEKAAADQQPLDDLLPTCPDHVWALVHRASPLLRLITALRALDAARAQLMVAANILHEVPALAPRRIVARLWEHAMGQRSRERRAREFLAHDLDCPVCRRLADVERRTVSLLFALLEDRHHRAAIERGEGLCLQHLALALPLAAPGARDALVQLERAKLAVLDWELDEMLRKAGWQCRPERRGTESTAWARALEKFSGSLVEGELKS